MPKISSMVINHPINVNTATLCEIEVDELIISIISFLSSFIKFCFIFGHFGYVMILVGNRQDQ